MSDTATQNELTTPSPGGQIPISKIGLHLENHRHADAHDQAELDALAQSMAAEGQQAPILVCEQPGWAKQNTPYTLIFGHRRITAARQLGWEFIRAEVLPPQTRERILELRLVENHHRSDLTAGEEIIAVDQLLKTVKGDVDLAAAKLGESVEWVRDRKYMADRLHAAAKDLAVRGALLIGHLRQICKVGDPYEQWKVACDAVGLPSWQIKPMTIQPLRKSDASTIDQFWERVAEGSVTRKTIRELEVAVNLATKSLRGVPWELDQVMPLPRGKGELPACVGCPHNTATDETLFGPAESGAGRCTNAECMARKYDAAKDAQQKVVTAIAKQKEPDTTPTAIKAKAPEWLKPGPVQRELAKVLPPTETPKGNKAAGGDEKQPKIKPDPKVKRAIAEQNYLNAFKEWQVGSLCEIGLSLKRATREAEFVAYLLLTMQSQRSCPSLYSARYAHNSIEETRQLPALGEDAKILDAAINLKWQVLAEHLIGDETFDPIELPIGASELLMHPHAIEQLAAAWGITIEPRPVWTWDGVPANPEQAVEPPASDDAAHADVQEEAVRAGEDQTIGFGTWCEDGQWYGRAVVEWPTYLHETVDYAADTQDEALRLAAAAARANLIEVLVSEGPTGDIDHAAALLPRLRQWCFEQGREWTFDANTNAHGVYTKCELIRFELPKSLKAKADIHVAQGADEWWRYGIDISLGVSGTSFSPSCWQAPLRTREEAIAAGIMDIDSQWHRQGGPAAKALKAFREIKVPGICHKCLCTETTPCDDEGGPCGWFDEEQTLCTACAAKEEDPFDPEPEKWREYSLQIPLSFAGVSFHGLSMLDQVGIKTVGQFITHLEKSERTPIATLTRIPRFGTKTAEKVLEAVRKWYRIYHADPGIDEPAWLGGGQ